MIIGLFIAAVVNAVVNIVQAAVSGNGGAIFRSILFGAFSLLGAAAAAASVGAIAASEAVVSVVDITVASAVAGLARLPNRLSEGSRVNDSQRSADRALELALGARNSRSADVRLAAGSAGFSLEELEALGIDAARKQGIVKRTADADLAGLDFIVGLENSSLSDIGLARIAIRNSLRARAVKGFVAGALYNYDGLARIASEEALEFVLTAGATRLGKTVVEFAIEAVLESGELDDGGFRATVVCGRSGCGGVVVRSKKAAL